MNVKIGGILTSDKCPKCKKKDLYLEVKYNGNVTKNTKRCLVKGCNYIANKKDKE